MGCKADKPKQKHKKGLWSPDEDQKLRDYIIKYGHGCWSSVPVNAGLQRNGKSCRLRWINYLRPGLKRGLFSMEEEEIVLALHRMLGNKWSQIAQHLPGRTDNEIKNHWHSYLKKRVINKQIISCNNKLADDNSSLGVAGSMGNLESSSSSSPSTSPLELIKSCTTTTTQNNNPIFLESIERQFDHGYSSTDTEPSAELEYFHPADHHQGQFLPKILFAEWLSMDQFRDQQLQNNYNSDHDHSSANPIINYADKHNNFDYYNSDFQDAFLTNHDDHQLFLQEGNFGCRADIVNHRGELISSNAINTVNNNTNMIQTTTTTDPKFEEDDHFSENGFVDFISGQFNIMTSDEMYL